MESLQLDPSSSALSNRIFCDDEIILSIIHAVWYGSHQIPVAFEMQQGQLTEFLLSFNFNSFTRLNSHIGS